jgi:hypothetical protein
MVIVIDSFKTGKNKSRKDKNNSNYAKYVEFLYK